MGNFWTEDSAMGRREGENDDDDAWRKQNRRKKEETRKM